MSKVLSGETLIKLAVVLSFFVCYGLVYRAMVKDEKFLAQKFASSDALHQTERIENPATPER